MNISSRFNEYIKDYVNLDPEVTKSARESRDKMLDKLKKLLNEDRTLPNLYEDIIHFGSFNRKTKCRKLDDIDLMICLSSEGSTANIYDVNNIVINTKESAETLNSYLNDRGNLSSTRLANKLKDIVTSIPEYSRSDVRRDGEAVILNLTSYEWSFDLVIAFVTVKFDDGNVYYIIPDGNGNWKRTQPKLDSLYTTKINQMYQSGILEYVRILKKINQIPSKKIFSSSYLLECMILDMFDNNCNIDGLTKMQVTLKIIDHLITNNYNSINDPKNIQGNLNTDDVQEKQSRLDKLKVIRDDIHNALSIETTNLESSIKLLKRVFGDNF